jgi:hypothetical protein
MSELTIGNIGTVLRVELLETDTSQNPPSQTPLDLTDAEVTLLYAITDPTGPPKTPVERSMTVEGDPTTGIASYVFADGDLVTPPEMGKNGIFRYSIRIFYPDDNVTLYTDTDASLTIKDDSQL